MIEKSLFFSELEDEISGEVGWQQKQYNITGSGTHSLLWEYDKDGNSSSDSDCGFVDFVRYSGTTASPPPDLTDWETSVKYKYNPSGQRIKKKVDNYTIRYIYDGGNVIGEYDINDNLLRKYIHGARVDEPVCMIDVADNNAIYYYHYDGSGSVVALSNSDGDSCQSYEYSAFGQVAASDPNFTANPYMFTGRRFDYETGLYYYRARYYNPYIGRFLQTDLIGYGDGMNLYAYCRNNPGNCFDPSGTTVIDYTLTSGYDPGTGTERIMFKISHDVILDSGQSSERWYFDSFDEWLEWIENNNEGRFTDEWMAEQAGYQLATYENEDADLEVIFDEYLFWNIQALDYMGAISTSEIGLLDSQGINFINNKAESNYFDIDGKINWRRDEDTLNPATLAHEFGHAIAFYTNQPNPYSENYAFQRENAVRWWYYINAGKDLIPIDDFVSINSPYTGTDASWSEYIAKGGFNWANPR